MMLVTWLYNYPVLDLDLVVRAYKKWEEANFLKRHPLRVNRKANETSLQTRHVLLGALSDHLE